MRATLSRPDIVISACLRLRQNLCKSRQGDIAISPLRIKILTP